MPSVANMTTTVLDLPPELIVRIASSLSTVELGPLRRSCKQIENALFDSFASEFFTKRQFMLEHESLEALLGIANHPGLALKLTEVIISTQVFYADFSGDLRTQRFHEGHVSRDVLVHTGLARDMLSEVFSKLPNLRTVGLRDYNGAGRARDGENARWRSWGWSLEGNRGTHLTTPDPILPLILSSLGAAKATPTSLEVILRHQPQLGHNAFLLPSGSLGRDLASVLRNLQTLMLAVSSGGASPGTAYGVPWVPYDEKSVESGPLKRFLHHCRNLESLRLNFLSDQFFGARFLEWLGKPQSLSAGLPQLTVLPIPPVALHSLRSLEIGMVNVAGHILLRAITKFDLQTFSLWKMVLQCPGPNSISRDCWAEFLDQLAKSLPDSNRLRTIMIGHVTQCYFPGPHNFLNGPRVTFVPERTTSEDKSKVKTLVQVKFQAQFAAQSAKQWLQELSERTFVPGIHTPAEPEPGPFDSEVDDDDDGDEDPENDGSSDDEDDV